MEEEGIRSLRFDRGRNKGDIALILIYGVNNSLIQGRHISISGGTLVITPSSVFRIGNP